MITRSMLIALGLVIFLGLFLFLSILSQAAMKDSDDKTIVLKDCDALEMTKAENHTRDLLIEYMRQVYVVTEENILLKKEIRRLKRKKLYVSP